jgi:tripartite-type tricarboxylate transporter receptor subunit TctC
MVMNLPRRQFFHLAAGAFAAPAIARHALADAYPSRPVTLVVPFAAGGSFDVIARIITPRLSELLGQQVIVENVGAAAGIVGVNRVAHAMPDGYSMLLGTVGTHAYNPALYKKLPYNPAADFAPVGLIPPEENDERKNVGVGAPLCRQSASHKAQSSYPRRSA